MASIHKQILGAIAGLLVGAASGYAQDADTPRATNLRLFQSLASRMAQAAVASLPRDDSGDASVTVLPKDLGWLIEDSIDAQFASGGHRLAASSGARLSAEFGITEMHVEYANIRTEHMFGSKILDRKVVLSMRAHAVDRPSGTILFSRELHEEARDTIALSDVASAENPALPVTRASLPSEGFFSSLAEPLIALGAIAVAVYLLFSVRS